MKPEQDDKMLEEMIRRAVGSEDAQFDAGSWKEKYRREVALLESRNTLAATTGHRRWRTWRSIMDKRSITIAASAVVAAAIVVAVIMFASGGGSTVAMADVMEQLQTKCYEFEMEARTVGGDVTTVKGMVLEPGKMRLEQRGGGSGTIVSIIDVDSGQSLILFERSKGAFRPDRKKVLGLGIFSFPMLPSRSIEGLWGLKAGDEVALGKKNIDGKSAEGFRVIQTYEGYIHTITVWADAKTRHPLEVEIAWKSSEQEKAVLELTLRDFQVIAEPNTALFSTELPAGYTLANSQTLEQLTAEPDTTTPATENTTAQAKKVLDAIALWAEGKEQKAIELLVAVDWTENIRFGREHYMFTMTERQYISLVWADQQKVMPEIIQQSSHCRAIARELAELGRKSRASKNIGQAEKYFSTAVRLGQLLNRDEEMIIIVRLVGIVTQTIALRELSSLYEELGEMQKLQHTQARIGHLEEQREKIRESVSGR
ncbi:MAG: hypothetical protein HQ592_02060 [Planctomycetes bacterium]|nr:hypothetical protein [Planctomycetota bacterium]